MRHLVTALLLCLMSLPILAQEGAGTGKDSQGCGIVYGKNHAFSVCAPKGWILDNSVLNDQGIFAVFYPQGSSWTKAKDTASVMYANVASKGMGQETVTELIAADSERTRKQAPAAQIVKGEDVPLKDGAAQVWRFTNSAYGRQEAVAYVDSPKVVTMLVLTSTNDKAFQRDYPAFLEMVKSYFFLSSDVSIHDNTKH